jgi:hypothetical protein
MAKRKLDGIWNAERVLHNYLRFADKDGYVCNIDYQDNYPHGIEKRRFSAAMKAYGRDVADSKKDDFERNGFHWFVSETYSTEKMCEFQKLLNQILDNDHLKEWFDRSEFIRGERDIRSLFKILFKYRKCLDDFRDAWSGLLEAPMCVCLVVKSAKALYNDHIKEVSDIMDRMLVLLMGDDYDKSFTETELLQFGYPDVTDDELEDMILDNY